MQFHAHLGHDVIQAFDDVAQLGLGPGGAKVAVHDGAVQDDVRGGCPLVLVLQGGELNDGDSYCGRATAAENVAH